MNANARPPTPAAMAILVGLCAIWGVNQVAIKLGNEGISPAWQAALRSTGAALLVLIWARARGLSLFERDGTLPAGLLAGALFAIEFALLFWAMEFTTAARAVVLLYTAPFTVALGAHFFLPGDPLTRDKALSLIACFAGVATLFADSLALPDRTALIGDALALLAGTFWGATTVAIKATKLARTSAEKTALYQLAVSALILPAVAFALGERGAFDPTPLVLGSLAFQIVIVVFASYTIWFWLVREYRASSLAAFSFLTPLFGVIAAHLLLDEPVTGTLAVSLALVGLGIWLVNRPARE
jgi:drug/metabolite transporter (DMT)-like permease